MTSGNKISIIIPVYKTPKQLLDKCVKSVINQSYKNIEIILVDDGSPDECGLFIDEYAKMDNRIIVIHKENGGLCSARNAGYSNASGEWITFLDSDDYLDINACEVLLDDALSKNVELVMCGLTRDYKNSSYPYNFYLEEKKYVGEECIWLQEQLFHYNCNIACVYAKLIKRSYLEKYKILHNETLRQGEEGLEFNFRLFEHLSSASFINAPFYHYVYCDTSISAVSTLKNNDYVIRCYEVIKSEIIDGTHADRLLPWFYNRMMQVVVTSVISGIYNPCLKLTFSKRKEELNKFASLNIVKETLNSKYFFDLSISRRIILKLIKWKSYILLYILGKIRRYQKTHA